MENAAPKVTVIVPFFNQPELLPKCIESIANSTYKNVEIIAVDDGSTDDSWEKISQQKVIGISTLKNIGPAAARNLGAKLATGEILMFFDSDVSVCTDSIERAANMLNEDPELSAVFGAYAIEPLYKNFFTVYKNLAHHFTHYISRKRVHTFWAGCGAIKKDVFTKLGGFDEGYQAPCVEDIELGYRLTENGYKVKLEPSIQVAHGKKYNLKTLITSDIKFRAIPWAKLLAIKNVFYADLNLRMTNIISGIILGLLIPICILAAWPLQELLLPFAIGLSIIYLLLNVRIFSFVLKQKGLVFLLKFIPMYTLTYFYSIAGFAMGAMPEVGRRLKKIFNRLFKRSQKNCDRTNPN